MSSRRELAERVSLTDMAIRRAEANHLDALCDFSESYSVDCDQILEVLCERRMRVGGSGTPKFSEFVTLELAGLLGCSPIAAAHRLAEALNLKHRHPLLYQAVQRCELEVGRARKVASKCARLTVEVAEQVSVRWLRSQAGLGWTAALNLLDRVTIEVDPQGALAREKLARADRGVHLWGLSEGCLNLTGRLDVLDGRYLDATLTGMADQLFEQYPDLTQQQRRAMSLGILAHPAQALAMQQAAAQPALPSQSEEKVPVEPPHADSEACPRCSHHAPGHLCGSITIPMSKLRPQLGIAVHLHVDSLGNLGAAARIDKAGWITKNLLAELLGNCDLSGSSQK